MDKLDVMTIKNEKGFTVVELLVASLVFSIIMVVVGGSFVDLLRLQRRGFAAQTIQEETLFFLESMSREIRVAQITSPNQCNLTSLSINHPIKGAIQYAISGNVINKTIGGISSSITSSKVDFSGLRFCVSGAGIDDQQPRVTVIAPVRVANGVGPTDLIFNIQTTVSSRDVTEEFIN